MPMYRPPNDPPPWPRATRRPAGVAAALAACAAASACSAGPAATRPAASPSTAPAAMPTHTNRLATEKSPYLLQHAHNPVDWYPWGEAAFAKARTEGKPILLSVGYSTCHWCHVMERESFEDESIAKLMNEHFVPVKVDREERPDVDRVYMTFVQATTGSGGWPMTVFLTPDLKPFYGGTYFPPDSRGGRIGFRQLLTKVHDLWRDERGRVTDSAGQLTNMLREIAAGDAAAAATQPAADAAVSPPLLAAALGRFEAQFDAKWGGFGSSPKFPEPPGLQLLLRLAAAAPADAAKASARAMLIKTLDGMAAGGMHDQLGGGFHRYSTDARWFLPHFEKMLYDQGQLAAVYVDAYRLTGDERYATVARGVLDYVLRDLTGPGGEFYCAEDADSARDPAHPREKTEGAFYVWPADEVERVVGADAAAVVAAHFGVRPRGNVDNDPHDEFGGQNVLAVVQTVEATAKQVDKAPAEVAGALAAAKGKLLAERGKRPRPHLDDKTLTAWSGLMITGFAKAGAALGAAGTVGDERYTAAAVRSATFVREHLYDETAKTLKRRWRDGHAEVDGFLEDYAYLVQGLLDLYEATLDHRWLAWAVDLQATQDARFWDAKAGGYFSTAEGDASLLVRMKDEQDGAEPSGNSVAAMNLLRLARMIDDAALAGRAKQTLAAFAGRARQSPRALPYLLAAGGLALAEPRQVVIAGDPKSPEAKALLAEVHRRYQPNRVVLGADGGPGQAWLAARSAAVKDMKPINGRPAAYVCEGYVCQQPTADPAELGRQLEK
jgi:uncharacterized protein YyaL (SSP411 family)